MWLTMARRLGTLLGRGLAGLQVYLSTPRSAHSEQKNVGLISLFYRRSRASVIRTGYAVDALG